MANTPPIAITPPATPANGKQIKHMDTIDAYDRWAETRARCNHFSRDFTRCSKQIRTAIIILDVGPKLIDRGCGTGRNTVPLTRTASATATIVGLEPSSKMLQIARDRVSKFLGTKSAESSASTALEATKEQGVPSTNDGRVSFYLYNLLHFDAADGGEGGLPATIGNVDGVISTLVMEHVPLGKFFEAASGMACRREVACWW
ncbi:hypothetical protein ACJ73_03770 [Blastomyces percursus]|uniref:Methyltransferase domain-containing protein n=1 Tax=Blastomyces percursus TaxID=1658174 RepID=A0A1J9Q8K1_9EURO|nr:hypothetical protein ACJ73_03770 [Blastomyces percursus]